MTKTAVLPEVLLVGHGAEEDGLGELGLAQTTEQAQVEEAVQQVAEEGEGKMDEVQKHLTDQFLIRMFHLYHNCFSCKLAELGSSTSDSTAPGGDAVVCFVQFSDVLFCFVVV